MESAYPYEFRLQLRSNSVVKYARYQEAIRLVFKYMPANIHQAPKVALLYLAMSPRGLGEGREEHHKRQALLENNYGNYENSVSYLGTHSLSILLVPHTPWPGCVTLQYQLSV